MRPLCLTMTAFGPYAAEQKLDFMELKDRTFFLIHGPTGSGKTTILDGMCFALYGDASGTQRDGKSMRSDHADGVIITEVMFDFSIGETRYQVKRIPEQERPKKRGEGTTTMVAQAELWRISLTGEPVLLAAKWLDVTRQIETILGFKSSQFRQVVLLPQGEFRKLLTANSSERQEIMQALFKTDLYRSIEEKLKDNASQLKKTNDELMKQRQWVLQEAGVIQESELLDSLQENQRAIENLAFQIKSASEELKETQQAVSQATVIQEKIKEKEKAQQLLVKLTERKIIMDEEKADLIKATKAAGLFDAEKNVNRLSQDVWELEENYKIHQAKVELGLKQQKELQQKFEIEAAKEGDREKTAHNIINLQQFEDKIIHLQESLEIVTLRQTEVCQAVEEKQKAELACTKGQQNIDDLLAKQQQYTQIGSQVGNWEAQWLEVQRLLTKRKLLEDNRQAFARLKQQVEVAALQLSKLDKEVETAKSSFLKLQHDWVQGQSALMASNLVPGVSCPVCGSTEHPKPAELVGNVPNESQIKEAQLQTEIVEKKREKCRTEWSSLQTEWNTWGKRITDLVEELQEQAEIPLAELTQRAHSRQEQYEQAMAANKKVKEVTEQLEKWMAEQIQHNKKLEKAEENYRQIDILSKAAEAVVQERKLAIPEEFQEKGKLAAALKIAQQEYQQYKIAWEQAQYNVQQGKQLLIKNQTVLENIQSRLTDSKQQYEKQQQQFIERVISADFRDKEDYEKAKKSQAAMQLAAEKIAAFDRDFNEASMRLEQAARAAVNLVPPDMTLLQKVAEEMQQRYNDVFAAHTNLESQIKRQQAWLGKILQLNKKLETLEAQYAVMGRLAEVANGGNEHKLTLQRFVLGTLLESVTVAANERLKMMSRNRYYLQRTFDRARKNAAGGLDLEVFDNYTGIARGVGTLSGGETFLASLSLALGLADVVQSYSGGIHLDTILVDEGFGTLDPESLDFAVKALIDLQQGGRLVGIISHVPELKERIDARLEVMTTERGSKACFKIG
jgi:exonuclease SbcC